MSKTDNLIGQVVTLKLISGEEIFGECGEYSGEHVVLHGPLTIMPGAKGPQVVSWFMISQGMEKKNDKRMFRFPKSSLMIPVPTPADPEVVNAHKQAFALIATPPNKQIIT